MENEELKLVKNQDVLLQEIEHSIESLNKVSSKETFDKLIRLINEFQGYPQLLDVKLAVFVSRLSEIYLASIGHQLKAEKDRTQTISTTESKTTIDDEKIQTEVSTVIYNFCKVRGSEIVSTLLSTDIRVFPLILRRVLSLVSDGTELRWPEISFLLLWLSVLILSPFELESMLQGCSNEIYDLCFTKITENVSLNGYVSDVNVVLFSKFLLRADMSRNLRKYYEYLKKNLSQLEEALKIMHLKIMTRLARGLRLDLDHDIITIHWTLVQEIMGEDHETVEDIEACNSPTVVRLLVESLGELGRLFAANSDGFEAMESIVGDVLLLTGSKDTTVRYCASTTLAKVTSLLPNEFQSEILEALLDQIELENVSFDSISVTKFHGALVSIAEFLKKRMIRTQDSRFLQTMASILSKTLFFQKSQMNSVVTGSVLRDASLYVVWNYIKYNFALVKEFPKIMVFLFKAVIFVAVFDTDLIIRRSAAAVLQETVGRHGGLLWTVLGVESRAHECSLRLAEVLEFGKLNDLKVCFLETSLVIYEMIPSMKLDFFQYLLGNFGYDGAVVDIQSTGLGIMSIEVDQSRFSSILLGQLISKEEVQIIEKYVDVLAGNLKHESKVISERSKRYGVLYAASEVYEVLKKHEYDHERLKMGVFNMISSSNYDFHKDSRFKGESILRSLRIFVPFMAHLDSKTVNLIFSIIRQTDKMILVQFQKLLQVLCGYNCVLDQSFYDKIQYFIKNGNLAMSKSVGYLGISQLTNHKIVDEMLKLTENKRVSYDIRLNIIYSYNVLLSEIAEEKTVLENPVIKKILPLVTAQLLDYTQTEQGDVGNKIRVEAIKTIGNNIHLFKSFESDVETNLLQLVCEVIDKVKYSSFKLLLLLKNDTQEMEKYSQQVHNNDYFEYYNYALQFYKANYLKGDPIYRFAFMKGIALTAGSFTGSSLSVPKSCLSVINFLESCERQVADKFISDLSFLLKPGAKAINYTHQKAGFYDHNEKIRNGALNLLNKVINSGFEVIMDQSSYPDQLAMAKKIYVRLYNFEISTKTPANIVNIVKIYQYLAIKGFYRLEIMKRYPILLQKFKKEPVQVAIVQSIYSILSQNRDGEKEEALEYLRSNDIKDVVRNIENGKFSL